ncbi:MAG: nucleoside hydrolase [Microbacterium sp.]|uniref:nucleoside hydrolase n=1 Tax=Microbacterium sp. TaxID=51671 RepID=UPI0026152CD2|nr:nucleoside hydrolase [Microbacterium sp.]MCX6502983.1 nucleoside hydrolase [Microbacterium sp.]
MSDRMPVYLDCDTGVDDSVALAYLLASPAIELVGVGTVSGNTTAAQGARNTLDLLALAGHSHIPVAVGAHDHIDHPYDGGAPHVHGENGIGGVEVPRAATEPDPRGAAQLLLDLSHEYAGNLRVVTIGPMTNLAHALEADPALPSRVAAVVTMGGAALAAGNITPVAEANVYNDPQGAAALLAADWDVTLVPLDVTMEHVLTEEQRGMLLASERPFVRAIGEILDHYFDFYLPTYGERSSALHDPLAAVIAASGVTPTVAPRVPVTVDTSWGPGRGQTIVDLRGQRLGARDHEGVRTRVVLQVDAPVAHHLVSTILAG